MKLSEMKALLTERGIQLTKSLGQSFLHDGNQLRRIVSAAQLGSEDQVLEIGPGLGPLTELLLSEAGSVLAIEKDARLVSVLQSRLGTRPRLTLLHGDGLDYVRTHRQWRNWKMVSNLPYSVASPILVELTQTEAGPERMVVTVQLEVAHRILAGPGDPDYGLLTLLLQLNYVPRDHFKIPASCFHPPPEVDSACLVLERKTIAALSGRNRALFCKVVKRAFSQRRKMMFKLLKADWPASRLEQVFAELELSPQTRAEAVGLEHFVRLTERLAATSPES